MDGNEVLQQALSADEILEKEKASSLHACTSKLE